MNIFLDNIRSEKNLLIAFLLISTVFIALVILMYPGDEAAVEQMSGFESMGDWEAVFGIVYGEGGEFRFWIAMLVFSYVGIIYTAIPALTGTSIFSKDNDERTLDILMANPITRQRILIEKIFSVLFMSFLSIVYLFLIIYFFSLVIDQNISFSILIASCFQLYMLLVFVGLLSSFFAILFLDSGRARLYVGFIIIGSFVLNMFVLFSEELEFLKYFQVFYYYDSASTILKPSFERIVWDKVIYLTLISIIIFGLILYVNNKNDLVPHYSHQVKTIKNKERGIPLLFFFVARLQNRYPSFVEQIQSDKLIIYIFTIIMVVSGIAYPPMYPGDEAWIKAYQTYASMSFLLGVVFRGHGVALSFKGYFAGECYINLFVFSGLFIMILGSKIVTRDHPTLDLLFSQSVPISKIFKERLAAITLEIFMLFLLCFLAYIIGIIISGYDLSYIPLIGVALLLLFLIMITITYLIVTTSVFIKKSSYAVAIAGVIYYGLLLTFLITYSIKSIRFLSTLTPFYWIDIIRIFYDQTIVLNDVIAIIAYLVIIFTCLILSNKKIIEHVYL